MPRLIDTTARGVYPIAVTPFLDDGAIDFASLDRLTDFFLEIGVPGLTVLGLLGEAARLSAEESLAVADHVLRRVDGRISVIVGASQTGFDELAGFAASVMDRGAAGIMVGPAQGLRTEQQVIGYLTQLCARIGPAVPIALQDYPQNSGVWMSPDTLCTLVQTLPNIQILKHEESSALRKITAMRAQESSGLRRRVSMLVGNSGLHLPQELARGVDGANTGVAFPEMLIAVCQRSFDGEPGRGEDLYDIFLPLIRHEWQTGIGLAIRKEIFRRRGLITTGRTRSPGPSLDRDDHQELSSLLARLSRRLRDAGEDAMSAACRIPDATA